MKDDRLYIARDKDGGLCIYHEKPTKDTDEWCPKGGYANDKWYEIPSCFYPEVKWEDKEPKELITK